MYTRRPYRQRPKTDMIFIGRSTSAVYNCESRSSNQTMSQISGRTFTVPSESSLINHSSQTITLVLGSSAPREKPCSCHLVPLLIIKLTCRPIWRHGTLAPVVLAPPTPPASQVLPRPPAARAPRRPTCLFPSSYILVQNMVLIWISRRESHPDMGH